MSEVLNSSESNEQNEAKVYDNISSFLSSFEQSEPFKMAYEERKNKLLKERPGLKLSSSDLILGLRSTSSYPRAMIDFYREGHTIPADLNQYDGEAKKALDEYFDNLKAVARQTDLIQYTADNREEEEMKLFLASKTRDRYHVAAGLALLGDGVELQNGDRIVCDEKYPDDENAISKAAYTSLGRTLVTMIAEENHLDIVDPDRDQKKLEAAAQFLNGGNYSDGHYVAKGER